MTISLVLILPVALALFTLWMSKLEARIVRGPSGEED